MSIDEATIKRPASGIKEIAVQVSVTGRHVEISDDVKDYINKKANKLLKFYDRVSAIEVILDREGNDVSVEMIVSADGTDHFIAQEIGPDTFALVDLLEHKLERQLRRHKERLRNRKHPEGRNDKFDEAV